jgi:hypothetical protein
MSLSSFGNAQLFFFGTIAADSVIDITSFDKELKFEEYGRVYGVTN